MTSQSPLNPEALEAMSRVMNPPAWGVIDRSPEDELVIMTKVAELSKAEKLARAYVDADKPESTRDQRIELGILIQKTLRQCGISVTYAMSGPSEFYDVAGILLREYPTLAVAQPVVTSAEELEALPPYSVVLDGFGVTWEKTAAGLPLPWASLHYTGNVKSSWLMHRSDRFIVLSRPEVKP